jgi:hypothetical protein
MRIIGVDYTGPAASSSSISESAKKASDPDFGPFTTISTSRTADASARNRPRG